MLKGEYNCKLDAKGRLMIPVKLREELKSEKLILSKGMEKCIQVYTEKEWEKIENRLLQLPDNKKQNRIYKRFVLSSAEELKIDNQNRIRLPQLLMDYASLSKNISVFGNGDHVEIWDTETWNNYYDEMSENIEDIVDSIEF